jgi:cathepsin D
VYTIDIGIGSNGEQFTVAIDLGTSDFWVPSTSCTTGGCDGRHFIESPNTTWKLDTWSSFYQEGTYFDAPGGFASGYLALDTVSFKSFTIQQVYFGIATQVDVNVTNEVEIRCELTDIVV